ncbi:MAG TPA: beta-ketoacyl synthase N-terminal-like domain-containing protein [Polyangiaceae bacterium]|nr:beta-ketoacyl synthase N-terminal-like domain-containing protein [Polyangiaceae bacterium]
MKTLGVLYAAGVRTALASGSLENAMLLRTGLASLDLAPLASAEGEPVTMSVDLAMDPFVVGEERAAAIAGAALDELAKKVGRDTARGLRTRVALAFPEPTPGQPRGDVGRILAARLRTALGETFGSPDVDVATRGSAGLAYVLPDALDALKRREVDAVIAGGVHTDYDPAALRVLEATGRLYTPESLDAVIPGEAAAFVLIGREDLGQRIGLPKLARIVSIATGTADMTPYNDESAFDASAMSDVIERAALGLGEDLRIGFAYGDHGIEHFRVRELYAALARKHDAFCEPMAIDSPSQRIGRTGAASLPLFLALLSESFRRSYAPSPVGMAFAGSDAGERAAILVSSP